MNETQTEYGMTPFQGIDAVNQSEVYLGERALQQVKTAYTTAVAVQKPRSIERVANNVLTESRLAGSAFYYRWEVKNNKTGRKSVVQGASIDLAMCIARNFGNCVVDVEATETATHYMIKGIFVDLETGFTVPRLYRQRKNQDIGGGYGADRAEDMVFQIAQSKAQRNAILKAMPAWLVEKCIEVAREAEVSQIKPENLVLARAKVLEFFGKYGISLERIEDKIERQMDLWTAEDIVDLRAAATALKEGRITANELFPTDKQDERKTDDLEARILKKNGGDSVIIKDGEYETERKAWNAIHNGRTIEPEKFPQAEAAIKENQIPADSIRKTFYMLCKTCNIPNDVADDYVSRAAGASKKTIEQVMETANSDPKPFFQHMSEWIQSKKDKGQGVGTPPAGAPVDPVEELRTSDQYKSFDPLGERPMQRYSLEKKQKLIDMLQATGKEYKADGTGNELHTRLLEIYAADPQPEAQEDDGPFQDVPDETRFASEAHAKNAQLAQDWPYQWEEARLYLNFPKDASSLSEQSVVGWNSKISRLVDLLNNN